jgi:uncharacterized protein
MGENTGVDQTPDLRFVENPERERYELWLGDVEVGFIDYRMDDGVRRLAYIEIDPAYGGRGLGTRLTEAALEDCRERGLKVTPECPFIADYIRRHPEVGDLVARPS